MSKETTPHTNQNEEIDLGQLFKIIGKGFQNLFDFISSIFGTLFKILILVLLHFYKQFKWYALVVFLGLILGYFLDKNAVTQYGANMFIETNFNSARQVYEVINEFNQLASKDRDFVELARRLNISPSQASSIEAFSITADIDDNKLMEMFVDYKYKLDSIAREEADFETYKEAQPDYKYNTHRIEVVSTDKYIFNKINKGLFSELINNEYINTVKETALANIDRREKNIDLEIKSLDSLVKTYLEIRKTESEKTFTSTQGNNFYLSGAEKSELIKDETALVSRIYELQNEKRDLAMQRVTSGQQINVISEFPNSGYNILVWYEYKVVLLPALALLIMLISFSLFNLGKFLKQREVNQ